MIMRRIAILAGLILCAALASQTTLVSAHSPLPMLSPQDDMNFNLEGKITAKDENKLTVSGDGNIIFHVVYNDKTEIKKKDGTPGAAQDLHTGVTIAVAGDLADSGEVTAKTITIEGEGAGKQ